MDITQYVSRATIIAIFLGSALGVLGAIVRALQEKEKAKAFMVRLITGGIVAAFVSYVLLKLSTPLWLIAVISWASGWKPYIMGNIMASFGTKKTKSLFDDNSPKSKDDD